MADTLKYQIRLYLTDEFAAVARADARDPSLKAVNDILDKYGMKMVCQLDALNAFCEEAEANGNTGPENELYHWTKHVVQQPIKQAKYSKQFTIYDLDDNQVYDEAIVDGLIAELGPLIGDGIIAQMSDKYNSDPAQNPQAPEQFRYKPDAPEAPEA